MVSADDSCAALSAQDRVQAAVAERLRLDLVLGPRGTRLARRARAVDLHQCGDLAGLVAALGDELAVLAGTALRHLRKWRRKLAVLFARCATE